MLNIIFLKLYINQDSESIIKELSFLAQFVQYLVIIWIDIYGVISQHSSRVIKYSHETQNGDICTV